MVLRALFCLPYSTCQFVSLRRGVQARAAFMVTGLPIALYQEEMYLLQEITSAPYTQRLQTLHQCAGISGRQPKLPLQEVLQPQSSQMSE